MEWIEVTGRTVEEAKEAALDRLGVVESDLEYEVIDTPRAGLLGRLVRSEARIRARVKPISREKPQRRRRPPRGQESGGRGSGGRGPRRGERKTPSTSSEGSRGGSRNRRRSGERSTAGVAAKPQRVETKKPDDVEEEVVDDKVRVPVGEQAEMAVRFARDIIDAFELEASVTSTVDDDIVLVDVAGDGLGLLVGQAGATLSALEELTRAAVQSQTGGHSARIRLDIGGYRRRRREALAAFTRKLAQEVVETGAVKALEPMPAADRKVVHDTVLDIPGVATESEGEEPRRRVVLRPE